MKANSWAVLGFSVCFAAAAVGEDVFLSESQPPVQPEAPLLDPGPTDSSPEDVPVPASAAELPPVLEQASPEDITASVYAQRGERKWRIIPFGRFKISADDNIFISKDNPESDVYYTLAPGIAAGWGDYAKMVQQLGDHEHYFEVPDLEVEANPQSFAFAKYVGSASIFTTHRDQDAFDHDTLVAGRWVSSRLTLGAGLYFKTLSGTDIDLGDRVKRKQYGANVTSSYYLSDKTSLELNLFNSSYNYDVGIDSREWVLEDWLNYQVLPKTKVSLGTHLGATEISSASTQTFEQLLARISYLASSKVGLTLDGGVELRQFGNGVDDLFTVFNLAGNYQPFDGTSIFLNAFRRNTASGAVAADTITETGVAARLRQRFLHRFYLTFESGYQNSEYRSAATGADSGRTDKSVYIKPSVSFDVTKYLSAESSYQYQHNDSSTTTFTENIVTFQINLQF